MKNFRGLITGGLVLNVGQGSPPRPRVVFIARRLESKNHFSHAYAIAHEVLFVLSGFMNIT